MRIENSERPARGCCGFAGAGSWRGIVAHPSLVLEGAQYVLNVLGVIEAVSSIGSRQTIICGHRRSPSSGDLHGGHQNQIVVNPGELGPLQFGSGYGACLKSDVQYILRTD